MHCLALTGLLSVLLVAAGGAQAPPILTETEFLSVLDETHPAVRESAESVALAEAGLRGTTTFDNPVIGAVREEPSSSVGQIEIMVSWQLPDVGRGARIAAHQRQIDAAKAHFAQRLADHRLAMRKVYADWAVADQRQRRLSIRAERVELLAKREARRSEKGEISGLEAHRLRLAASALRSRVAMAAAEAEQARARVTAWYVELPDGVRPMLPELPPVPSVDGSNLMVLAAEEDLAAAKLAIMAARRVVSSPEISLGWLRQEAGSESLDGPIIGLAWSVPLFDRKQAARDTAEAKRKTAEARLGRVQREVDTSRVSARNSLTHLSTALAQTRQDLAINDRILDGAEAAFRHGEVPLTDLLETHRSVVEAELAMLDLHAAALAAHRDLEGLAGSATSPLHIETTIKKPQSRNH